MSASDHSRHVTIQDQVMVLHKNTMITTNAKKMVCAQKTGPGQNSECGRHLPINPPLRTCPMLSQSSSQCPRGNGYRVARLSHQWTVILERSRWQMPLQMF